MEDKFKPLAEWLETHPAQSVFQLMMLEKESKLVGVKNQFGEITFTNPTNAQNGLALLLDGVTVKIGNTWEIVAENQTIEPSEPEVVDEEDVEDLDGTN
jgi:hypothetical protein